MQAARRAKECGFDGIELFSAYNALPDQFWLPFNNRRDDKWGGVVRKPHAVLAHDPGTHPQDGGR